MLEVIRTMIACTILLSFCSALWSQIQNIEYKPAFVLYGALSKIEQKQFARIENAIDFSAIWTKHCVGEAKISPAIDHLVVDFKKLDAICIFLGKGKTANGIEVIQVIEEPDCWRIRCEVLWFSSGLGHPGKSPWMVTAIPRTSKKVLVEFAERETKEGPITGWRKVHEWDKKNEK